MALEKEHSVQTLCQVLGVSRSGFYAHGRKDQGVRALADQALRPKIQQAFEQGRGLYRSPRLRVLLGQQGVRCGKNRLARLLRQLDLRARQKRKFRPPRTTRVDPRAPVAPNWLARIPTPDRPDQAWASDITYIPTAQGWLYLAVTLDLCSRKCVGWKTAVSLETSLVTEAWNQAWLGRHPGPRLLHHSDRGVQYTSAHFRALLAEKQCAASMSRTGNPYDNAWAESFFATLKTECFGNFLPATHQQAQLLIFAYIETFYNPRRLHSALGYKSPVDFENQFN